MPPCRPWPFVTQHGNSRASSSDAEHVQAVWRSSRRCSIVSGEPAQYRRQFFGEVLGLAEVAHVRAGQFDYCGLEVGGEPCSASYLEWPAAALSRLLPELPTWVDWRSTRPGCRLRPVELMSPRDPRLGPIGAAPMGSGMLAPRRPITSDSLHLLAGPSTSYDGRCGSRQRLARPGPWRLPDDLPEDSRNSGICPCRPDCRTLAKATPPAHTPRSARLLRSAAAWASGT
jgi:hypothetical protein